MARKYQAKLGGVSVAAGILNKLNSETGDSVLGDLTMLDEELSQAIQDQMIGFEQLARADNRSLQNLIHEIDSHLLQMALAGSAKLVRDQFLKNMSNRSRTIFLGEMEVLGSLRRSDVEESRKKITREARRLSDLGRFTLPSGDYI